MNLDTLLIVINSWWPDAVVEDGRVRARVLSPAKNRCNNHLKKRPRLRPFFLQATVLGSLNLY